MKLIPPSPARLMQTGLVIPAIWFGWHLVNVATETSRFEAVFCRDMPACVRVEPRTVVVGDTVGLSWLVVTSPDRTLPTVMQANQAYAAALKALPGYAEHVDGTLRVSFEKESE